MINKENERNHVETVIEEHKKHKNLFKFNYYRFQIFLIALCSGFILIFCIYLLSDESKINGITINNNYYLSDQEVISLLNIDEDTRRLFLFERNSIKNLLAHPLIEVANLEINNQGTVVVDIVEKRIVGYRYNEQPELITNEGELISLDENLMYLIAMLPMVTGFEMLPVKNDENHDAYEEAQTNFHLLTSELGKISVANTEQISEIRQYAYSYDEYGVLCVMKDGNYVYTSLDAIDVLKNYNSVASYLTDSKNCLYVDEISKNISKQLCPEEKAIEEALAEENGQNNDENEDNSE